MFACLFQPACQQGLFEVAPRAAEASPAGGPERAALDALAREFSPRVQVHRNALVSLDIGGLGRLLGTPGEIGDALRRAAADRGLHPHIAIAPTRTAALLLALARAGVTVVPPGGERTAVAPLSLAVLRQLPSGGHRTEVLRHRDEVLRSRSEAPHSGRSRPSTGSDDVEAGSAVADRLRRWGLKTLGDLAGLPARPLSERLGQGGVMWQRLARGEDLQPLVATEPEAPIEETLELEWPIEGLEPLSFVLARICEPLSERLAALDLAAVVLHLSFRLVSRETATRVLQLPAPMRDPKVLRTLVLLHLESHPLTGGVDRLTLRVDTAPARITQFSLLSRTRPFPEQMATLLARLSALLGESRVGAPALVDSHRPGAFATARFSGGSEPAPSAPGDAGTGPPPEPRVALRRFRVPVPARVTVHAGRPVRVTTGQRGLDGGAVATAVGPWRTSGEWWRSPERAPFDALRAARAGRGPERAEGWNRDEWDVALADGGIYRIYRDRSRDRWFMDGIVD
jgi:protein ImuB